MSPVGFLPDGGYFLCPAKTKHQTNKTELNLNDKPDQDKLLHIAELLYSHVGPIDQLIEITDESMIPTFKPRSLAALNNMLYPDLLVWSEYYYIIDSNDLGLVRRVYASDKPNYIKLVSDHPDQFIYPPIEIYRNQIKAIYKVRAAIVKL